MNRWCLRCFVKVSRDEAFLISGGREFQRAWAATLKALSPNVLSLVWGRTGGSRPVSEDHSFREGWRRSVRY